MKIAVSVSGKEKDKGPDSPYFKALVAAGVHPEEIQMVSAGDRNVAAGPEIFDGVLFTGGEDVDPVLYDEQKKYPDVHTHRPRDDFEMELLKKGMKLRLPVLGICRGIQMINVSFGGTLYQDLKSDTPLERDHKQTASRGEPTHSITVTEPDSWLHGVVQGSCRVNSLHHQAINRTGRGLKVVAHSEDGLVEAVELADQYPFFLAVQWHPEEMIPDDSMQRKILEMFVAKCQERAERRGV